MSLLYRSCVKVLFCYEEPGGRRKDTPTLLQREIPFLFNLVTMYNCSSIVLSYLYSYFSVRKKRYTYLLIDVLFTFHKSIVGHVICTSKDIQLSLSLSQKSKIIIIVNLNHATVFKRLNNNVATYCIGTR